MPSPFSVIVKTLAMVRLQIYRRAGWRDCGHGVSSYPADVDGAERGVMTSGVRMLPINVYQRYMLVSQETSWYNKDDHRDIKYSFVSFQEVLSYIMHFVFLSIEGISSLPAGITLITMSRPQVTSSWCHRSLSSILLCLSVSMFLSSTEEIQERGSGAVPIEYGKKSGNKTNNPHWIYLLILFLDRTLSWLQCTSLGKIPEPGEQPSDTTLVSS